MIGPPKITMSSEAKKEIVDSNYDIVAATNSYFDDQLEKIKKVYDPNGSYSYVLSKDQSNRNIVSVLNSDNNSTVFKGTYELAGIYNFFNSVWYWAYNVQFVDREITKGVKVVKQIVQIIEENYKKVPPKDADNLHFRTSNDNYYTTLANVELNVRLAMFLMRGKWVISLLQDGSGKSTVVNVMDKELSCKDGKLKRMEYLVITEIIQIG